MVRWSGEYPGTIETAEASLVATFKKNGEGNIRKMNICEDNISEGNIRELAWNNLVIWSRF